MIASAGGTYGVPAFRPAASLPATFATCSWIPNTTAPAVPHEAAMDADLDRGVCARVACVGRDRSDSRLGHLETGEQVVQEPLKTSIEQNLVAPDSALSCAFKN